MDIGPKKIDRRKFKGPVSDEQKAKMKVTRAVNRAKLGSKPKRRTDIDPALPEDRGYGDCSVATFGWRRKYIEEDWS